MPWLPVNREKIRLLEVLKGRDHVLFTFLLPSELDKIHTPVILTPSSSVEAMKSEVEKMADVRNFKISSNQTSATVSLNLSGGEELQVQLLFNFFENGYYFLDPEAVFQDSRLLKAGVRLPSFEHLFEFAVLKAFLRRSGLPVEARRYFEDLHILLQEDLLEFFNNKYQTNFRSMATLSRFDPVQYEHIVKVLGSLPINGFLKRVNTRWHTFLGSLRQRI